MASYLILNPILLKQAIIAQVVQDNEEAAIQAVPADVSMPNVVVVVDLDLVMGMPRFLVNGAGDELLSDHVPVVNRV